MARTLGKKLGMRLCIPVVAAFLAATPAAAEPERIAFSDLADPLAMMFNDPYRDMGGEMLNELKVLVQLDQKLADAELDADVRARLEDRRAAAKEKLAADGQDVDALLAQRWDVARKRQTARMAINPIMDGAEVMLSGYLIPGPRDADGAWYGYLVSQVGMCSHLPPPPPNQLVRVKLRADQQAQTLYVPVQVSGQLRAEPSDQTIFILDGETRMISGWTLEAATLALTEG